MKDIPRIIYNASGHSTDIDEVLDRLIEHKIISGEYREEIKKELLLNINCALILQLLCELDELRFRFDYQGESLRKGIGRSLEALNSPIHYDFR